MSQPFGYKGEEGTCVWCGRKLRPITVTATDADRDNPTYKEIGPQYATVEGGLGYEGGGLFDTQRCGFLFGRILATKGHRLRVKEALAL